MRTVTLLCLLAVPLSCSSPVAPDNPFDPNTPPELQRSGQVTGRVVLTDGGSDAQYAQTQVSLSGGDTIVGVVTTDGSFEISGVTPGAYALRFVLSGYREHAPITLVVHPGSSTDAGVTLLEPARAGLRGAVEVSGGVVSPVGAVVTARASGQAVAYTAVTDSAGRFFFDSIPVAAYSVGVSRSDLTSACITDVQLIEDGEIVEIESIQLFQANAVMTFTDSAGQVVTATSNSTVTLQVLSFGAISARYSEDPTAIEDATFEPMLTSMPWTLTAPDGPKVLYGQFLDACGQPSLLYNTSIILDQQPPQNPDVVISGGAQYLNNSDGHAALRLSAVDTVTDVVAMYLSLDGSDPANSSVQSYVSDLVAPLGASDGFKTVRALFVDAAGNISAEAQSTITKDSTPPAPLSPCPPVPLSPAITINNENASGVIAGLVAELGFNFDVTDEPTFMVVSNCSGESCTTWGAAAETFTLMTTVPFLTWCVFNPTIM